MRATQLRRELERFDPSLPIGRAWTPPSSWYVDPAFADLEQGQAAVWRGVQSVLAVSERYPELRSADQFLALQAQLEGSENRINVARMVFNDAVRDYNAARVKLPMSLVAQARGLERRPYFGASASSHAAVVPSFE